MTRDYKYRRDGTPCPPGMDGLLEWARDFENKKVVEQTHFANGILVSTVWLGLDHGFGDNHRPLIFESMIFFGDRSCGETWRYSTEEDARLGHRMLVKKWSDYKTAEQVLAEIKP